MKMVPLRRGDLIPLDHFRELVGCKGFIDYDGYGYYATAAEMDEEHKVWPSSITEGEQAPEWATHVMWFNR